MTSHRKPSAHRWDITVALAIAGTATALLILGFTGPAQLHDPQTPVPVLPATVGGAILVGGPMPATPPPASERPSPAPSTPPAAQPVARHTQTPPVHSQRPASHPVQRPATPPAASTLDMDNGFEVWCTNGYLHADGSCSSTAEFPTFPQPPVDNPCAGTASQCLDALTGTRNDIATMLGSGTK